MNDETRTDIAWSGVCNKCLACYVVYPHPDAKEDDRSWLASGPNEWDSFTSCFVCDGGIEWNGSDPTASIIR